ncbi:HAD family hydrolase [Chromobacterium alticapitis]|uniref:HAD family hydrolase n=1 Tax=Chromobacterium alticapitis TaxID=2073169 RepID=A0A2S5DDS0_9NEIS|nr:HAD family hydrolase [Chromobacterium alticapitis]POZ61255.1 HAD family hydrolase [Chromobacterium alticapitis]
MPGFELVIFDCDGVLVDSERITNAVFARMLNELGLPVTLDDMFRHFVGLSMAQCLRQIEDMLGAAAPAGFEADYRRRSQEALRQSLAAVPGVPDMLEALPLPYCVASNGGHDKMRTTLGLTGLLPLCEGRLYSAQDVALPKPAPDVFLHAARSQGVEPARCLVIEDTPTGVRAGAAAGMTVWGYAALTPKASLTAAGATETFADMADLPGLLGRR